MPFEYPEDPEAQAQAMEAMMKTLGPLMLVSGWEAVTVAAVDNETGARLPHVLIRFEGRDNGSIELGTQAMLFSLADIENLLRTLVAQLGGLEQPEGQEWLRQVLDGEDPGC